MTKIKVGDRVMLKSWTLVLSMSKKDNDRLFNLVGATGTVEGREADTGDNLLVFFDEYGVALVPFASVLKLVKFGG